MNTRVLVLDSTGRPIGVRPLSRLLSRHERLHVVKSDTCTIHVDGKTVAKPLIIQWPDYVEIPYSKRKYVSRRVLFARDKFACQYCSYTATPGQSSRQLTLDHVKPAHLYSSRGAATFWENVTTACFDCNQKKGGKLPMECGMMPRTTPRQPNYVQLRFHDAHKLHPVQRDYIRDYFGGNDE